MNDGAARGDRSPPRVLVGVGELCGEGVTVGLCRDESRHLVGVLRRKVGDHVVVLDGAGRVARGVIAAVGGELQVTLEELRTEAPSAASQVSVALGILTSQAMDWAIQKAVELGVGRVVPLLTERTQVGRSAARKRCEHWQRVARQALKQCRRAWAMEIAAPSSLTELVRELDAPRCAVYGHADGQWCSTVADALRPSALLIGPEGGFSEVELRMLDDAGLTGICFGPHVLRADTAATVGAAWLVARHEGNVTEQR